MTPQTLEAAQMEGTSPSYNHLIISWHGYCVLCIYGLYGAIQMLLLLLLFIY